MGGRTTKCFSTGNGKLAWENELMRELAERSLSCQAISFNETLSQFILIVWPNSEGGDYRFVRLDSNSGRLCDATKLDPATKFKFCVAGTLLLTSWGDVFRTDDLELIGSLPFENLA